jgi:hypothetical protein
MNKREENIKNVIVMLAPKFLQQIESNRSKISKGLVERNFVFVFANIYFRGQKANLDANDQSLHENRLH